MTENNICKNHSGFESEIIRNRENIAELWKKWNFMQGMLIANLVGIILLLVKPLIFK